jgi:hypothetical protein
MLALSQCRHRSCLVSIKESLIYLSHLNHYQKEVEIDAIGGWHALRRTKKSKELVGLLEKWAQEYNLKTDWCLDHAVNALRGWLYEDDMRFVDKFPSLLERTLISGWLDDLTRVEFHLAFSRYELQAIALSSDSGDPPQLVFEWKGMRFETAGWNYVREGKKDWRGRVEQEYDRFKDQRKAGGQPVPVGSLTALRKVMAAHVNEQDAAKRTAVKEHGLVKRPRNYADHALEDHIKWLIMYQIPPCQKYGEIAELFGKGRVTIRKSVEAAAKRIDLPLRNPREHTGRPVGSKNTSTHRTAYRERVVPRKKSGDK